MRDYYIGIDPGKKGAITILSVNNQAQISDMPLQENGDIDALNIFYILKDMQNENCFCILEKAHAMPKQGVVSVFNYGKGYGKIQAVLEMLNISYMEMTSQKWKKEFSLIKKDKKESVMIAGKLKPEQNFRTERGRLLDGRAESFLIAEYARRKNL